MSDADLVNWLRGCVSRLINGDTVDGDIEVEKLTAAADRIEALAGEVERLTKERDEFAAILASPLADKVVEYGDRAESAERALAEAVEIMRPFAEGSIDIAEAAIIIGYPVAKPALAAARDFITAQEKEKA